MLHHASCYKKSRIFMHIWPHFRAYAPMLCLFVVIDWCTYVHLCLLSGVIKLCHIISTTLLHWRGRWTWVHFRRLWSVTQGRIQGGPKKVSHRSLHITSSNTVRFSKFFHCHILLEICNTAVIKYPTSPQTCCCTTLWNTYVIKLVRPQSVKCVTSFRFTKLKYNENF